MSALHPLPSAAPSSGKATAGRSAAEATQEISFAALLTAQLGLPVSPESLASTTDSEQPAFEQKSDAQVAADPQVSSDPAAALPFVPFDLPVTSAKITVEDAGQGDQPHNPITAFLPGR